jgi:alkyl sulfatase BDS1-like metallo-beta-lactamase superfamily hydrolase
MRFAATLLNHAVFAAPDHRGAKNALAAVYDTLGQGAENGTWRNFYLTGAQELRSGIRRTELDTTNPEMAMALSVDQLIDSLAIRIDGPRAWDTGLAVDWILTDENRRWRITLSNGALTYRSSPADSAPATAADVSLTLTKPQLLGVLAGQGLDGVTVDGDSKVLAALMGFLDTPDPDFAIVTP